MNWYLISFTINLSKGIIEEFKNDLYWDMIFSNPSLNFELIKYIISLGKYIDWKSISENSYLTVSMLKEYEHSLDWNLISENRRVDQEILEKFHHKFDEKKHWDIFKRFTAKLNKISTQVFP